MTDRTEQFEQLFHSEFGRMYKAAYILLGQGRQPTPSKSV